MKNLLIAFILIFGFSVLGIAQDAKPAKKEQTKKEQPKTKAAPAAKAAAPAKAEKAAKAEKKPEAAKAKAAGEKPVVLKKDGTPDKRFKNSDAKAGPLKKDGTPDLRYKANKEKAKEKKQGKVDRSDHYFTLKNYGSERNVFSGYPLTQFNPDFQFDMTGIKEIR